VSYGYINGRHLMERQGSDVSAVIRFDGFVLRAQVLDEASGEWWLSVEAAVAVPSGTPGRSAVSAMSAGVTPSQWLW
jgi:hypothetical protein